jgi:nodulation protein F
MADALADDIIRKIEQHGGLEPGSVTMDSELSTLGIHSLELTEIIFDIEDQYGIHVEMNTAEAWNNLRNVGDIVSAVRKLIEAKG